MKYICGFCGKETDIRQKGDAIQCRHCGRRILFKKRTAQRKFSQFFSSLLNINFLLILTHSSILDIQYEAR